jgi:hypothetical protein
LFLLPFPLLVPRLADLFSNLERPGGAKEHEVTSLRKSWLQQQLRFR